MLTKPQVWSFAPPEDDTEDFRSSSPMSMPDHSSDDLYSQPPPVHPISALPSAASAPSLQRVSNVPSISSDNDTPMPDAGMPA